MTRGIPRSSTVCTHDMLSCHSYPHRLCQGHSCNHPCPSPCKGNLAVAQRLHRHNHRVIFNWVPSNVGLAGNEAADREAKAAASNPHVHVGITPSLAHTRRKTRISTQETARAENKRLKASTTTSATQYRTATHYSPLPLPRTVPVPTRVAIHRLWLG